MDAQARTLDRPSPVDRLEVVARRSGEDPSVRPGSRGAAEPKQALADELLATLVERRLRWLPAVRDEFARDAWCMLRLTLPLWHERDPRGRNWDLSGFECGPIDETVCVERFRAIVDRLRDEFDIT